MTETGAIDTFRSRGDTEQGLSLNSGAEMTGTGKFRTFRARGDRNRGIPNIQGQG